MSLVLKSSVETEVYISEYGYVVLKQIDGCGEESFVTLSPEQSEAVSAFLLENAGKQKQLWLSNSDRVEGEAE